MSKEWGPLATVSPLIQSAIGKLYIWLQKRCNCWQTKCCIRYYCPRACGTYTLTTTSKRQHWEPILYCCICIKYVHCLWFERFECLYLVYCAWAGFGGGEVQVDELHMCYCLHAIQHVTWYVHTLLICYLRLSCKIFSNSTSTRVQMSSLN